MDFIEIITPQGEISYLRISSIESISPIDKGGAKSEIVMRYDLQNNYLSFKTPEEIYQKLVALGFD